jgi:outer membrane protein assembly factor BamB
VPTLVGVAFLLGYFGQVRPLLAGSFSAPGIPRPSSPRIGPNRLRLLARTPRTRASVAALDKLTGKTVWVSTFGDKASYSSIVVGSACEVKQYVAFTAATVVGLRAADGELLWRYAEPAHHPDWGDVNVATPIFANDSVERIRAPEPTKRVG